MWKFIRRLFVLLILFTIIFLVYRYVNPVWASKFVEKVKWVAEMVWFGDVEISGTTLSITWDVEEIVDESWAVEVLSWDDDLSWLQELNNEIDSILWQVEEDTWSIMSGDNLWLTWDLQEWILNTWDINTGDIDTWSVTTWEVIGTWEITTDTWSLVDTGDVDTGDIDTWDNQLEWLDDDDYEDIKDIFWNLVE